MSRRWLRRAAMIAALLLFTVCAGTIGFTVIEGYSLFDAFYMTLTTITTVGYGEIHPLSRAGRLFNSFLIFFGVSVMFLVFGTITQAIIELELQDQYGKRRKKRLMQKMHDHFIVCGFGRVGRNASYELKRSKVPFIVLDRNPQRVERAMQSEMLAVVADATRDDDLREVGVPRARGLIAALPSDAENLFIILSAKGLNPNLTVVTRASEEEAGEKLRRAGADTVFAPYTIAGQRLAQALVRPHVVQFLDLATTDVVPKVALEQVRVAPQTQFVSKTLGEMIADRKLGITVLAIRKSDAQMIFNPPAETKIDAGDFLIVLGEQPNLQELESVLT
jgi:voltage-gated potassium channel